MPSLVWTESVAGGAVYRPLDGWDYEYVPMGGTIAILHDATAVGMVATITSGADQLQARAPVPAGGTTGVIPSMFDVPAILDEVAAGDRIKVLYENTTGGAVIVNGTIDYKPGI